MELLNRYFSGNSIYKVEIAFIITQHPIKEINLFYLKGKYHDSVYIDNSGYLNDLYNRVLFDKSGKSKSELYTELTDGELSDIIYSKKYYSYVRIINDFNNSDNNGKIMLFSFGKTILDKIKYYLMTNNKKQIENTFILNAKKQYQYRTFDNSGFLKKHYIEYDNTLNPDDIVKNIKHYKIPILKSRYDKINKIKEKINESKHT